MNDKTKYQIMGNRELLKGYSAADIGAEKTDQQQKIPGPVPVKTYKTAIQIHLPVDFWRSGNSAELDFLFENDGRFEQLYSRKKKQTRI